MTAECSCAETCRNCVDAGGRSTDDLCCMNPAEALEQRDKKDFGSNTLRKYLTLRLKKLGGRHEPKKSETSLDNEQNNQFCHSEDHVMDITVAEGDSAQLQCRLSDDFSDVQWIGPDGQKISNNSTYMAEVSDDCNAVLCIRSAQVPHTGHYTCLASSTATDTFKGTVGLTVLGCPSTPSKLVISEQLDSRVCLKWNPPMSAGNLPITAYTVELLEQGVDVWQVAVAFTPYCQQMIEGLNPGRTYLFRVRASNDLGIGEASLPSDSVAIPYREVNTSNYATVEEFRVFWKTNFAKDFEELDELGRGRFSVVKRCRGKLTKLEVAAKFISKKRTELEIAENEYLMLQMLKHSQLICIFDTYQTPLSYVLILQLVNGLRLFELICEQPCYKEITIATYLEQLLEVIQYLHNCQIVYLDLKPENLLVDLTDVSPLLKLVDLGDAHEIGSNGYVHCLYGSPEFAAPEVVSRRPISTAADIWSVGVILYVLLSGMSPFLDDCREETCLNILDNDYSFPEEYFGNVSDEAKDLIRRLLNGLPSERPTVQECLDSKWIRQCDSSKELSTIPLQAFLERRKYESAAL